MEKQVRFDGWSVKLTTEWPFIRFNPFEDKQPTIGKKPIPVIAENAKKSSPTKAAAPKPKPTPKPAVSSKPKPEAQAPAPPAPTPEAEAEATPATLPDTFIVTDYTPKSFVVVGKLDGLHDQMAKNFGSYSRNVSISGHKLGEGYIFSNKRLEAVSQIIGQ